MKGIEWIKINTNMCEDEKMRLIDSMELRDPAYYVWIRLLLQAGKVNDNGLIYLKKDVPYTKEMLSILFNRPLDIIEKVMKILESFKMIKVYENNIIKICNWEKHQNIEGMKKVRENNRERVKNFREKKKKENENLNNEKLNNDEALNSAVDNRNNTNKINKNKNCNVNVTLQKEKREEDKRNKIKNTDKKERVVREDVSEIECIKDKEFESNSSKELSSKFKVVSLSHKEINAQAFKIINALEETKVKIRGLTKNWIIEVLGIHKEKYIKMAIGKAIERNKLDVNYINGILKNWLREGYPKTYEEMELNNCEGSNLSVIKAKPNLKFINFEPRQYDYDDLEERLLGWK